MIISKEGNITVITQERASIPDLIHSLNNSYKKFQNDNLVLNLSTLDTIEFDELLEFLPLSNKHRGENHSFVIVNNSFNIDEIPDEILIVPTLQEAFDIIEMEEMERDLGI